MFGLVLITTKIAEYANYANQTFIKFNSNEKKNAFTAWEGSLLIREGQKLLREGKIGGI